ncbi:hypothetical protein Ahy_B09g096405 isoform B [Arachis hypogaea]|uniref:Uncharacterized protein n=2 Tax=Arachis hypogaea TaxID=3818 RepID=A0A444XKE5_ARAHY|nr:hypothetical protein Ahy_B09g096405 isoform B [Arachis hypogaea]
MDKLYHDCYDSERTFEENIKHRPPESLQTIGDGTSIIAIVKRQRRSVRKMLRIDQSSFTSTLAGRKPWQGLKKKSRNDKGGELVDENCFS